LDVAALLEPRAQPEPLLGELARHHPVVGRDEERKAAAGEALGLVVDGQRLAVAAVPALADPALTALPGQAAHRLVLAELGGRDLGLVGRQRAKAELLVEREVD